MKISDAATKGRELLNPRQGNDLYLPDEEGCKYGGCYRGMALVGAGAVKLPIEALESIDSEEGIDLVGVLINTWPWTGTVKVHNLPCTCKGKTYEDFLIHQAIAHLWDKHHAPNEVLGDKPTIEWQNDPWTFERITDWLRSIEPQDPP